MHMSIFMHPVNGITNRFIIDQLYKVGPAWMQTQSNACEQNGMMIMNHHIVVSRHKRRTIETWVHVLFMRFRGVLRQAELFARSVCTIRLYVHTLIQRSITRMRCVWLFPHDFVRCSHSFRNFAGCDCTIASHSSSICNHDSNTFATIQLVRR